MTHRCAICRQKCSETYQEQRPSGENGHFQRWYYCKKHRPMGPVEREVQVRRFGAGSEARVNLYGDGRVWRRKAPA